MNYKKFEISRTLYDINYRDIILKNIKDIDNINISEILNIIRSKKQIIDKYKLNKFVVYTCITGTYLVIFNQKKLKKYNKFITFNKNLSQIDSNLINMVYNDISGRPSYILDEGKLNKKYTWDYYIDDFKNENMIQVTWDNEIIKYDNSEKILVERFINNFYNNKYLIDNKLYVNNKTYNDITKYYTNYNIIIYNKNQLRKIKIDNLKTLIKQKRPLKF